MGAFCLLKTPFNSSFDTRLLQGSNHTTQLYRHHLSDAFLAQCRDVFVQSSALRNFVPKAVTSEALNSTTDAKGCIKMVQKY